MKRSHLIMLLLVVLCIQGVSAHKDLPQQMPAKPQTITTTLQSMYKRMSQDSTALLAAFGFILILAYSASQYDM
ncbi:MAG TPA: hypothetical protein PLU71_04420 [Candidatus Dependentiae bacterium]|nr:hypothetical protein [Candidatus Dependentiae bacterium]HRQ63077.1 hypothetical protein [Candidatus Dependentiae bacterium]